ncbi:hypothetical protein BH09MYX1_BH09MYX1_43440 [soil metagenome]
MVTSKNSHWMILVAAGLCGCGGTSGATPTKATTNPQPDGTHVAAPPGSKTYDPAQGFVVHEWGTNTIVVGTDGVLLPGLHHEEEDLPAFVYDRMKATQLGAPFRDTVNTKMETPVDYFYASAPLKVNVEVSFPKGILTQWYPATSAFGPQLVAPAGGVPADPVLDPKFPFTQESCRTELARAEGGFLRWQDVQVMGRTEKPTLMDAPLDRYSWSYARDVAANPLRVPAPAYDAKSAPQDEDFLFYRGLGNVPLPVTVTAQAGAPGFDGGVRLQNTDIANAMGAVVVMRVGETGGAFTIHREGIPSGGTLEDVAPSLDGQLPMNEFVAKLSDAVVNQLALTGLYGDEAAAMVNTWKRQWFRTPGVRVLYLMPQAWTDTQIPLTIDPVPAKTVRVMMIRVEVLTRSLEEGDFKAALAIETEGTAGAGAAHFTALGRFAEPRLRRALALGAGGKNGAALLAEMGGTGIGSRQSE